MALCSPGIILYVFVAGLLLGPGCLCFFPALDDYGRDDSQLSNPMQGGGGQPYGYQDACYPAGSRPCEPPIPPQQSSDWPTFTPPESPFRSGVPNGQKPSPEEMQPSRTPPPPSPWPPPKPRGNEGGSSQTYGEEQGKNTSSNIASRVGWALLTVVLVLQVVLGAYLAYQWREMNRFGMWMEKIPSVSPPPSPAGFAPYTAAR